MAAVLRRFPVSRWLAVFGVADALHHHLQQCPGGLGVLHRERAEGPRHEQQAAQVGLGGDLRRPVRVVDQRHLAEIVAGAQGARGPAVHADRGGPGDDDAEAGAGAVLVVMTVPGGNVRSWASLASSASCFFDSMENSGTCAKTSAGVVMARRYTRGGMTGPARRYDRPSAVGREPAFSRRQGRRLIRAKWSQPLAARSRRRRLTLRTSTRLPFTANDSCAAVKCSRSAEVLPSIRSTSAAAR